MISPQTKRPCLYCGEPTGRGRKGEHIVPEAIGGALTLNDVSTRAVCPKCNSGVLAQLDRELCSRSFLSAIASKSMRTSGDASGDSRDHGATVPCSTSIPFK